MTTAPHLLVSGHLTDSPDRRSARFPETQVPRVAAQLRDRLTALGVSKGWLLLTGGARGTDLLAAEAALQLGANVRLCLAMPPDQFVAASVRTDDPAPGRDWEALFHQIAAVADVAVLPAPSTQTARTQAGSRFEDANRWMLDQLAEQQNIYGLVVWDGATGKTGGTWQIITRLDQLTGHDSTRLAVIDPTPRRYETRQDPAAQKRVLALDGGGIRGIVTLRILRRVEQQLRVSLGKPDLVLADYFDLIAGTSTGAVIAAGLASGLKIDEMSDAYERLGTRAFHRTPTALLKLSRFSSTAIRGELQTFFGPDTTLGDPMYRTLMLLVMHNTTTDSTWLLTNNTRAKYNAADRLLPGNRDRNLDLNLVELIRGSTAAPTYFAPQQIALGDRCFTFADGGITAFNNPALIAVVTATLPAYQLGWARGAERLLVASIGTGSAAAIPRKPPRTRLGQAASALTRLIPFFMNGASFSQDLLCRVFGDCRHGPPIDREVGALTAGGQGIHRSGSAPAPTSLGLPTDSIDPGGVPGEPDLFSYVRYDASLATADLTAAGIRSRHHRAIRRLDAVDRIAELTRIGDHAAADVNVPSHFQGFL